MDRKKIIFLLIWLGLVSLGPLTILKNTPLELLSGNRILLVNFIQRILGLLAFTMIFVQVILGSFMQMWTERLGGWIFKFHIIEGLTVYILILLHPTMFVFLNYLAGHGFDPFYVFTNICFLCNPKIEYFYTLGRVSFWLLNVTVFAALFRTSTPFMRLHWRKFHVLNYLVFLLVGLHGFFVGTDFRSFPFFGFAVVAYAIILYIVVFKKLPELYNNFSSWLRS